MELKGPHNIYNSATNLIRINLMLLAMLAWSSTLTIKIIDGRVSLMKEQSEPKRTQGAHAWIHVACIWPSKFRTCHLSTMSKKSSSAGELSVVFSNFSSSSPPAMAPGAPQTSKASSRSPKVRTLFQENIPKFSYNVSVSNRVRALVWPILEVDYRREIAWE